MSHPPRRLSLMTAGRRLVARLGPGLPRLVLVLDRRLDDPLAAVAALPHGAGVLLRAPTPDAMRTLGRAVAPLCRRRGLVLIVAGDWRLAEAIGAAGLHLPEAVARHGRLGPALAWRRRGADRLLTVACHGPAALARARALGADAALLSPLFPTRSHPGAPALGPTRFRLWARGAGLPVIALGGVDAATAPAAVEAGAAGLAAVSGLSPRAG